MTTNGETRATASSREAEIWARLDTVTDPELDETVTELNFITNIDLAPDNRVEIGFRLPTYWCAANFSFLMADDIRRAVTALPWVKGVKVVLCEHMYADKINAGLADGLSFEATFGGEADGDLDELRQQFLVKAFQRRQVALLNHLTGAGYAIGKLVAMRLTDLGALSLDGEGERLLQRYIDRRDFVAPTGPDALAFVDADGAPLSEDGYSAYLSKLRRVGINAEFNSALCRGLLSVRFDLETPFIPTRAAQNRAPDFTPTSSQQ